MLAEEVAKQYGIDYGELEDLKRLLRQHSNASDADNDDP